MTKQTTFKSIAVLSLFTLFIAGCTQQPVPDASSSDSKNAIEQSNTADSKPTVGSSTETSDIESELDDTVIENEDFSDL